MRKCVYGYSTTPLETLFRSLLSRPLLKRLLLYIDQISAFADRNVGFHGLRSGCAISPAIAGTKLDAIMDHIGWKSPSTAHHYIKSNQVLHPGGSLFLVEKRFNGCLQGI